MKNQFSKYMMIAAAAAALWAAAEAKAGPGGNGGTTSGPTPVEEQAVPAKTAVHIVYTCGQTNGNCTTTFSVPIGMRLVVENITGFLHSFSSSPRWMLIQSSLDGVNQQRTFFPTLFVASDNTFRNSYTQTTKFYADSLGTMTVENSYGGSPAIKLDGYLVKK